ncbi:MAG: imidazole glycerol phosphate synthase subunit HisH [Desulfamplus sp.]|nr:imidazole glycerol phosphate synthase subunit HisH [Desulfamplus sp.]
MIVIVDYGAGNLTSVARAVSYLGYDSVITDDPEKIASAERVIFPGVGAAGAAMEVMRKKGIDHALKQTFESGIPMLGICVGCQIIMESSEENNALCLGLIPGKTTMFSAQNSMSSAQSSISASQNSISTSQNSISASQNSISTSQNSMTSSVLKVPHMGWNGLNIVQEHPLLNGIKPEDEFYFVHSYFPVPVDQGDVYGKTEYGITFASVIGRNHLFATQFHLEKSGEPGLLILKNFCLWES